ncbi:hypothetical protein F5Y10DRAFT_230155 [Nemania abortiva]|nr:hypothetical protein F5Y10DRAFT_230155 [Nemania abortiva]
MNARLQRQRFILLHHFITCKPSTQEPNITTSTPADRQFTKKPNQAIIKMPYQPNTPLFNPIMRAARPSTPVMRAPFSTTSHRGLANATPTAAGQNTGFLRRMASTPRGRVSLAAAVVVRCVIDYELWTLYGAKYFGGKKGE